MGSNWAKLKKAVENGDEAKALEIYEKCSEIQAKLNANAILNEHTLDTYMHLSAYHGMVEFLRLLIKNNNGNPNKLNRRKQTVLHKVCQGAKDSVQYECMKLLLDWRDTSCATVHSSSSSLAISKPPQTQPQQQQAQATTSKCSDSAKENYNNNNNNLNCSNSSSSNLKGQNFQIDININCKDEVSLSLTLLIYLIKLLNLNNYFIKHTKQNQSMKTLRYITQQCIICQLV